MKIAVLVLAATFFAAASTSAENVYVSQSGTGTGGSCTSARSISWLNTSGNWANPKQTGKVGPGDTVSLCGSVTSAITLQGSGSSGAYITVDGSGATLGTSAGFDTNNKSWWTIQDVTWADGATRPILNVEGGSNGIFTRAHADAVSADPIVWLGQYNASVLPSNIRISDSYLRTGSADYGNTQHDMIKTEGSTNIVIEGNYLEMRAGGAGTSAHDDVIQTFEKGGTTAGGPSNWTIRYNWIVMNSNASSDRSWTMLESLSGTNNIYGNVFLGLQGAGGANGLNANSNRTGVVFNIYNNTFVAKNGASNNVINMSSPGTANIVNNVFHLGGQTALTGTMTKNRSYNLWFGSSIPSCSGITGETCGQDPLFTNYSGNNFSLQSGSPAKGTGTSLGAGPSGQSFDSGLMAGAVWPDPAIGKRGTSWDKGGFLSGGTTSAGAPAAPENVRIVR
jgi:hypothetical protein